MFFQGYGTNPFVDTEDDPLSTFGIDVDTASYTMARSYLRRGNLPPADAVRVEEFVNYFDYGDRAPKSRDFAVVAEGAPSPFASTARTYLLRFALKGAGGRRASRRQPAVLTFVVDISGSMNRENRLGLVKRALRLLVARARSRATRSDWWSTAAGGGCCWRRRATTRESWRRSIACSREARPTPRRA